MVESEKLRKLAILKNLKITRLKLFRLAIKTQERLPWQYWGQKQPPEVFCKKRCSLKFRKFHRKAPVLEPLFKKVAGVKTYNFIKMRLQRRCFPVKFPKFLRTPWRTSTKDCFCGVLKMFFAWECEILIVYPL